MPVAFREAVEAGSLERMEAALHPGVVFNSPVVFTPYEGRDAVMFLLGHVIEVFEDFRYTDELAGEGVHGLVFKARVGDRELQGWDLLKLDEEGLVTELTVMVRPLSGAMALAEAMKARVEAAA